jgi:DNA polymerase-4
VWLSGLTGAVQQPLFETGLGDTGPAEPPPAEPPPGGEPSGPHREPADPDGAISADHRRRPEPWRAGDDVRHARYGHGWVQGSGHGRVTVRFETRSTGPGPARTLAADDPELSPADPLASLD